MIKEKIPSKYQLDIYREYDTTNNNIVIEAGPGCAKSHVLKELLKRTPKFKKSILCAFNRSIKEELESQVPSNVEVKTVHGLAFGILRKNVYKNFKVNGFKNFILCKKHLKLDKLKPKERDSYIFMISKIIDLSRLNLCKTREEIEQVCVQYNISTINGEINDALEMIEVLDEYNSEDHREFMVDFVDMLHLTFTMVKSADYPKYHVVMCDELQDLCPLHKAIIERIISPTNGRFVGCGDEKQSIYSFIGANTQAFTSFKQRPRTTVLPLSVTYRCAKNIVKLANQIFPGLEAFESNIDGVVRNGIIEEVESGDFVICRNNLPLVEAWIKIVRQGKQATILGKEFGKGLLTIIGKLDNFNNYDEGVAKLIKDKEDQLREKGIKNPTVTSNYQQLIEKLTIIDILKKEFGSFEVMRDRIEQIFSDDESRGVVLMTIHKSKGLETNRVFALDFEKLLPSKYATTELELNQERCLKFVCVTRAKYELVFINSD